jgi:uncharacterized protein YndB with AHSA1/START domain
MDASAEVVMERGTERCSIEREIHVDASPGVVYEVVSRPEHLRGWWPDDADLEKRSRARRARSSSVSGAGRTRSSSD